jgi:hypothetical protein
MALGFIRAILALTLRAAVASLPPCKNALHGILVEPRTYFWPAKISKLLTELPQPLLFHPIEPHAPNTVFIHL